MSEVNVTLARYQYSVEFPDKKTGIITTIDGITMSVPLDTANRHYAEILRQVEAGTLVIQEADSNE